MAERRNFPNSRSGQRGPPPAHVRLTSSDGRQRMNIHIGRITGGVAVGNNMSVTTVEHGNPDDSSSSSDGDSNDSDCAIGLPPAANFPMNVFREMKKEMRQQKQQMRHSNNPASFNATDMPHIEVLNIGQNNTSEVRAFDRDGRPIRLSSQTGHATTRSMPRATTRQTTPTSNPRGSTPQTMPTSTPRGSTPQTMPTSTPRGSTPQTMPTSNPRLSTPQSQTSPTAQNHRPAPEYDTSTMTTYERKTLIVNDLLKKIGQCQNKVVSDTEIHEMAPSFGIGWRRVFRWLGLKDMVIDITHLEKRGVQETVHTLLVMWKQQCGACTFKTLLEALVRADQLDIVRFVTRKFLQIQLCI